VIEREGEYNRHSNFPEGYESNIHKEAKEKLFNMLSNGLKIIDQNGENYRYGWDDEFLHMESPILNYKNSVLYSNSKRKLPCFKYLNFNYTHNKNLLCNQKGHYGNISNLPCKECIIKNCDLKLLDVGFIPDISYGYNGIHSVWFEINYKHPSTLEKLFFCYTKNIMLFEFDAEYILNLDWNTEKIKHKRYSVKEYDNELIANMKILLLKNRKPTIERRILYILSNPPTNFSHSKLNYYADDIIKEYDLNVKLVGNWDRL
jgi:hypothetical protein